MRFAALVLLAAACSTPVADVPVVPETAPDTTALEEPDVPPSPPPGTLDSPPLGEGLCLAGVPDGAGKDAVARLKDLGVHRVRSDLPWDVAEPTKGDFHLDALEAQVGPYLDAGIAVTGILAYGNPWATSVPGADKFYPPDDPADFARYVTAVVTHFAPRITDYEVWNEENAGYRFWKTNPLGDPPAYGALLRAAVAAGRAACATCRFAFGAPFFHAQIITGHVDFLAEVQTAWPDIADAYDAMGFHPYPFYPPQAAPEGPPPSSEMAIADMAAAVRATMAAAGPVRPLWTTEFGWPVYNKIDETRQAAYLVRATLELTAAGATPTCWYNLFDGPKFTEFPPEDAFGLLTFADPPQPKPAYHALAQLGGSFASFRLVRDLRAAGLVPDGVYGYALAGPSGETWWAIWTYPDDGPIPVAADVAETLSMTGEPLAAFAASMTPVFGRLAAAR